MVFSSVSRGQQPAADWQVQVRRRAEAHDWTGAMRIVDQEMARSPGGMDVKVWRARILTWSGHLAEAEREYQEILAAVPNDPDNWMGLASVYSREGQEQDALRAASRAVELDAKRADLRVARGRLLRAAGEVQDAKLDFEQALALDPANAEARAGVQSFRGDPKHELRFGANTDLFNFTGANHDGGVSLTSRWTSSWRSSIAGNFYQLFGQDAAKFTASVTGSLPGWGGLTVGGAAARDNGVIPKGEAFFDYDHGWKLSESGFIRGVEAVYAQHWYWYTTARIMTLNGTAIVYLPHEWRWSIGLTEGRSHFSGTGAEWRPSGTARLGFPITRLVAGNVFFATGTENFAQADQIGRFSSHTYGGGLRFQWTSRQDVSGFAGYQTRTQGRTDTSFGFTYGIHF